MENTCNCQLSCFPRVRVSRAWLRQFNNHRDFSNEGTVHLFGLIALYSYADYRSDYHRFGTQLYCEQPGQWTCRIKSLPRILRVESEEAAVKRMEYYAALGLLSFEMVDRENCVLRYTIKNWKRNGIFLEYSYYSYKGSGFFFFPREDGKKLIQAAGRSGRRVFSELDAAMDLWLHTVYNDPKVRGSQCCPVVYFADMKGRPLLSYAYLGRRWRWSKSKVGRFMLKAAAAGLIIKIHYAGTAGSAIVVCQYLKMLTGHDLLPESLTALAAALELPIRKI